MKDPRFNNSVIRGSSIPEFFTHYTTTLSNALSRVPAENLELAIKTLDKAVQAGRTVFVAGNGGSAAISDHLCCDWTKGTACDAHAPIRTHSLVSNSALLTAISNDFGYQYSISKQLELLSQPGDVVVLISSSGNSPNIVEATRVSKSRGLAVIGLTGFSGGELKAMCDVSLHVDFANYGVVEDCHQVIMHTMAQYIANIRDKRLKD